MLRKGYYYKTCVMQHGLDELEADAAFLPDAAPEGGAV